MPTPTPIPGDTTPTIISNIIVSNITQTSASISWTTDEIVTSQVEYGTTSGTLNSIEIATTVASGSTGFYSNKAGLKNLNSGITYYYKIKSTDTSSNNSYSTLRSFTTQVPPTPTPTPTPFSCAPTSTPGGGINVGIYLIHGYNSEIYGRTDCIADSAQQIQWVTCVEALSEPYFYPQRDNFSYSYSVANQSGVVLDSGSWTPSWSTSHSSCPSNNGSGNMYTQAYNLTNLTSGTPYTFTVSGTNAGESFGATAVFKTQ